MSRSAASTFHFCARSKNVLRTSSVLAKAGCSSPRVRNTLLDRPASGYPGPAHFLRAPPRASIRQPQFSPCLAPDLMEIHPKTLEALETWWARRGLEPPTRRLSRARKNASKRPEARSKALGLNGPHPGSRSVNGCLALAGLTRNPRSCSSRKLLKTPRHDRRRVRRIRRDGAPSLSPARSLGEVRRSVRLWHKEAPAEVTGARFEVQEGNPLAKDHPCQLYHNPGQVKLVCEVDNCPES